MNEENVMKIIENSKFSPYVTESGEKLSEVLISDDEKWICILGGYMPLDLICGYNAGRNELLTIDGNAIDLPLKARLPQYRRDIDRFFKDRGIYYAELPKKAEDEYYDARHTAGMNIDREDFGRVRYLWEKGVANNKDTENGWHIYEGGKTNRLVQRKPEGDPIFELVLSDNEIQKLVDTVQEGEDGLSNYLKFDDYKNEFSICNGIELLSRLDYPANEEGLGYGFLRKLWIRST